MKHLNNLREQVDLLLQQAHSEIVMSAYNWKLGNHNDVNCGCNYCQLLRPYVAAKKELHLHKKMMDSHWYTECVADIYKDEEKLNSLNERIKTLKVDKDSLKFNRRIPAVIVDDDNGIVMYTSGIF